MLSKLRIDPGMEVMPTIAVYFAPGFFLRRKGRVESINGDSAVVVFGGVVCGDKQFDVSMSISTDLLQPFDFFSQQAAEETTI